MRAVATAKTAARDLTAHQVELLRRALKPYVGRCSGKARALATMMGVDQSGFGRFLNGKQGTSWGVASRAAAMMGLTVDALLGATPEDLAFPNIHDDDALAAARLAFIDGTSRAQIETRYREAQAKGLRGFRVDDWHRKLSGGLDHDALAAANPKITPKKGRGGRQKKT